jgi:hypothetical protein
MLCYAHTNGQADPSNSTLIHKTEVQFVPARLEPRKETETPGSQAFQRCNWKTV